MQTRFTERAVERTDAPADRPRDGLDVRELGPPKPLTRTLETLADLDAETVLVQANDRAPQHLYPKLDDRGYEFETVTDDEVVLTAIWREE
ncbi:DUF2249 domain-containing protein [Halorussus limi]|uniref:DUF2249 domain-containing protein n=1 Tax=Halorussus limi TaxID=2938695 RepID=A0A8U0HXJ8_9EURY|nr:DUF2249 domain-containing protein [Halorussus limi]UPV75366.1 DUF2249 domain-containing protein [Halorussus limi]